MFKSMLPPLMSQATRIAKQDDDLAQDILIMAYSTYNNALKRGKILSIGELVNLMKYRAGDLRKGTRLPVGNVSEKTTFDVYNIKNFFNGNVELLSLDFKSKDNECSEDSFDGRGALTAATACRDCSVNVLFEVGFENFLKQLTPQSRQVLMLRLAGYNCSEIVRKACISRSTLKTKLKNVGRKFVKYFALPDSYLKRYGVA